MKAAQFGRQMAWIYAEIVGKWKNGKRKIHTGWFEGQRRRLVIDCAAARWQHVDANSWFVRPKERKKGAFPRSSFRYLLQREGQWKASKMETRRVEKVDFEWNNDWGNSTESINISKVEIEGNMADIRAFKVHTLVVIHSNEFLFPSELLSKQEKEIIASRWLVGWGPFPSLWLRVSHLITNMALVVGSCCNCIQRKCSADSFCR